MPSKESGWYMVRGARLVCMLAIIMATA